MLAAKNNKFIALDLKGYLVNSSNSYDVVFDLKSVLPNSKSDI